MRQLLLLALLFGAPWLTGCGKPAPPDSNRIPLPPTPEKRRLAIKLVAQTAQYDAPAAEEEPDKTKPGDKSEPVVPLSELLQDAKGDRAIELFGPLPGKKVFDWAAYRGQVVLVVFWSSQTPESLETLKSLEKLLDFFHHRPLAVVGVNVDEDPASAEDYLKLNPTTFENILDGAQDNALQKRYPPTQLPVVACVNKQGKIVKLDVNDNFMTDRIDEYLREPFDGPAPAIRPRHLLSSGGGATSAAQRSAGSSSNSSDDSTYETKTTARNAPKKTSSSQPAGKGTLSEAKTGSGKKGRGYGGGIYTEPLRAKFLSEQRIVFEIQIVKAMNFFQVTNDRVPNSHEEFMKAIIEENQITLPDLPANHEYVYQPETGKLMVWAPQEE